MPGTQPCDLPQGHEPPAQTEYLQFGEVEIVLDA
jgi:hypothetical protein